MNTLSGFDMNACSILFQLHVCKELSNLVACHNQGRADEYACVHIRNTDFNLVGSCIAASICACYTPSQQNGNFLAFLLPRLPV